VGGAILLLVARTVAKAAAPWPRAELATVAAAIAVYQLAFFAAVDRTGVAVGTVVALGSAPALAGIAGRLLDGEPLTRRWAQATALACAGVMLLVLGGGEASVDPLGIMLAVVSGSGYATYAVLAKRLLRAGHAPERVMAASFSLGALLLAPVLVLGDVSWVATTDGLAMALFLGAIPTALAYVLFARGLRHLTPGETATLTLAEPLTATGLGILALGERPGAIAAIGAALVLAGLLTLAAPERKPRPKLAPAPA
jgi:DME family drug/metabolite transporter